MAQGLWHYAANLQVVDSNLAHTCVCEICAQGDALQPYFPVAASTEARQINLTQAASNNEGKWESD